MREQHSSLEETDDQNCNRTNHLIRFVHDLKTTVTLINFLGFFFSRFIQPTSSRYYMVQKWLTGTSWTTYLVVIEWCNDLIMCPNWWTIRQCVCQEEHLLLVYSLINLFLEHKCKGGCLMTWITNEGHILVHLYTFFAKTNLQLTLNKFQYSK